MFPLKPLKPKKEALPKLKESHVQRTQHGMGDYYGTGAKNSVGRMRDASVGFRPVTPKKLGKPPKSVV